MSFLSTKAKLKKHLAFTQMSFHMTICEIASATSTNFFFCFWTPMTRLLNSNMSVNNRKLKFNLCFQLKVLSSCY